MKVLQNFQEIRVLWHGRTYLTEVPGRYKNVVPVPRVFVALAYRAYRKSYRSCRSSGYGYECPVQKFRVRVIPGYIHGLGGGVRFEMEDFFQLAWHVLTGPTSPRQSAVAVRAISTTTTEAINREPQRVANGATAALTATVL